MKVKEFIKVLEQLDGEKTIGTFYISSDEVFSEMELIPFSKEVVETFFKGIEKPGGLKYDYYL